MKFSHFSLVMISGFIWLAVGAYLLPLGLNFLVEAGHPVREGTFLPLVSFFRFFLLGPEEAAIAILSASLLFGYFKGRYILSKSVTRGIQRIQTFPNPTSIANIYSAKYYILLGGMMGLGMGVKLLGMPLDIRGLVDVTIGAALINGAIIYFRAAFNLKNKEATTCGKETL